MLAPREVNEALLVEHSVRKRVCNTPQAD
jgi:hypothetical protein